MKKAEFLRALEGVIEAPTGTLQGDERLQDLAGWNSLAVLAFIAFADLDLKTTVSVDGLANCQTVGDLAALFPGKITD